MQFTRCGQYGLIAFSQLSWLSDGMADPELPIWWS